MADGQFREDLFFRLNVVCITLPPLRQRRDEIPALTRLFLRQYCRALQQAAAGARPDTLRLFAEYDWPGNVRELENLVKRAVILGSDESIRRELADAIAGRTRAAGPIPALQHATAPAVAAPRAAPPFRRQVPRHLRRRHAAAGR